MKIVDAEDRETPAAREKQLRYAYPRGKCGCYHARLFTQSKLVPASPLVWKSNASIVTRHLKEPI